jgi:hypothetical protein
MQVLDRVAAKLANDDKQIDGTLHRARGLVRCDGFHAHERSLGGDAPSLVRKDSEEMSGNSLAGSL